MKVGKNDQIEIEYVPVAVPGDVQEYKLYLRVNGNRLNEKPIDKGTVTKGHIAEREFLFSEFFYMINQFRAS